MPHWLPTMLLVTRTGALSLVVLAGLGAAPYDGGDDIRATPAARPAAEQRLIGRHDCSTTGFAGATPASALVRSPSGALHLVAYDRGLFSLARAGSMVALCLDDPPSHLNG
jgi:hypothetical protein